MMSAPLNALARVVICAGMKPAELLLAPPSFPITVSFGVGISMVNKGLCFEGDEGVVEEDVDEFEPFLSTLAMLVLFFKSVLILIQKVGVLRSGCKQASSSLLLTEGLVAAYIIRG